MSLFLLSFLASKSWQWLINFIHIAIKKHSLERSNKKLLGWSLYLIIFSLVQWILNISMQQSYMGGLLKHIAEPICSSSSRLKAWESGKLMV